MDTNNYWIRQNINCVSWKMLEMEFKFSKLVKSMSLGVSAPTKRLAAHYSIRFA